MTGDAARTQTRAGGARGHRLGPHTADLVLDAWGPTRASCLEEAATALVESFCDTGQVSATASVPVGIDAHSDLDVFADLLEEVVYLAEVVDVVPVSVSLVEDESGGVGGFLDVARVSAVTVTGACPKGVSYGDLALARRDGGWFAHAVVDV